MVEENKENLIGDKKDKKSGILKGIVIICVIGLIVGSLIIFYPRDSDKFKFGGLDWNKIAEEDKIFYYSNFRIMSGLPVYNVVFINDPRENNIEIDQGTFFKFYPKVFVSISPTAVECEENNAAGEVLANFFNSMKIDTRKAVSENSSEGIVKNCQKYEDDETVIIIEKSDYPHIWQPNKHCYILKVGVCESVKTAEKFIEGFILQWYDIEGYMKRKNVND